MHAMEFIAYTLDLNEFENYYTKAFNRLAKTSITHDNQD